jgi:hypothetical protein
MMRKFLNSGRRIGALAWVMGLASMPVLADDEKAELGNSDKQVTVVVDVSGDQAEGVKKAIEKLEGQLKNSGIPDALQQKALEAMRGQLEKSAGDGNAYSGKSQWSSKEQNSESSSTEKPGAAERNSPSGRFAFQLPFDPTQSGFPNAMVKAFSASNSLGSAQKEKLRDGIREALEQAAVDSEVIEKALKGVDKTLNQFGSQRSFAWSASGKLPYRVGIGCKAKDEADSQPGLEVETVFEDTPAAKAGVRPGDRLIRIDAQSIQTHDDIVSAVQKAGEEHRTVKIEVMRGEESTEYEIKPEQTALAEFDMELFQPGGQPGAPFRGQAWVIPQWPQDGANPFNDPKIQERIRDAVKDAMEGARRATAEMGATRNSRKESTPAEERNERNIDKLQEELKEVHKDLEEMKEALKKLADKP